MSMIVTIVIDTDGFFPDEGLELQRVLDDLADQLPDGDLHPDEEVLGDSRGNVCGTITIERTRR